MTKISDKFIDEELQAIGVKFTDETAPKQMPTMEHREEPGSQKKPEPKRCEAVDAKYAPVPMYVPSFLDRLKGCAKWAVTFGSLSMLFFYWQQTGLMDPAAAVPSMCACTCLAGFGVGRYALR